MHGARKNKKIRGLAGTPKNSNKFSQAYAENAILPRTLLKPQLDMNAYYARLAELLNRGWVKRTWILEQIKVWQDTGEARNVFCLTGDPGVGKSVIAAQAVEARDMLNIAGVHFCRRGSVFDDPKSVFIQLAFQLATQIPSYAHVILNSTFPWDTAGAEDVFRQAFVDVACESIDGGQRTHVLIIDALDEAPLGLVKILSDNAVNCPPWLRFFVTSRPRSGAGGSVFAAMLENLNPAFLDAKEEKNMRDMRVYMDTRLQPLSAISALPTFRQKLEEAIGGNFQYASVVLDNILQKAEKDTNIFAEYANGQRDFPVGLHATYARYFREQFSDLDEYDDEILPILSPLATAVMPIPRAVLADVSKTPVRKLGRVLSRLASFVHADEHISFYHRSVAEWLTDKKSNADYQVDEAEGHTALATALVKELLETCRENAANTASRISSFGFHSLPTHIAGACTRRGNLDGKKLEAIGLTKDAMQEIAPVLSTVCPVTETSSWEEKQSLKNFYQSLRDAAAVLFGEEDVVTASFSETLANALMDLGNYAAAKNLWEHIQAVRFAKWLAEDHPPYGDGINLTNTWEGLALSLSHLGEFAAAKPLYEQVLQTRRLILGQEDPDTLTAMQNLANSLNDLGEYSAAKTLEEEVLETRRRIQGHEHPDTNAAIHDLTD